MHRPDLDRLRLIKTFPSLIKYLKEDLGWPVEADDPEDATFEYTTEELDIDPGKAAKIKDIRQLRPFTTDQPWGIFWINFEPRRLPIVVLRCLLSALAIKRRTTVKRSMHPTWFTNDLLFISSYGEEGERAITFAHFSQSPETDDIPMLRVLGWDDQDTVLHLDYAHQMLVERLSWNPRYESDLDTWRQNWSTAFQQRHRESIETSKELAIKLADLARRIRRRVNQILEYESEDGPLRSLHKGFREALIHDLSPDDFADMYAQTVTYGLLSARIVDPKSKTGADFAAHMHSSPFLKDLMESFLRVGKKKTGANAARINFDKLGLNEITQLLDRANIEAVVRDFGDRNPEEDPVIHFYEDFLKEYDAEKRMRRGVFYTPRPVVSYIVRSVDESLRTSFGLRDGLADIATWGEMAKRHKDLKIPEDTPPDQAFVQILDPATGTGTFLVEIIDKIHRTLISKWEAQGDSGAKIEARWNEYVPKHLLSRIHGYELLMAPYAIAHLKIGLKLYETGYRFGANERVRIFLTNSLEPPLIKQLRLDYLPALAHEAEAVNDIKKNQRFTIVLGNPPYSKMSGNLSAAAASLIEPFRQVAGERIVVKAALAHELNLQDDYVKFYGLMFALLRKARTGIGSYISNFGYLDSPSLQGMRWNLLQEMDRLSFVNLGGRIADRKPSGEVDENVFDIEQGVAISTLVRLPKHNIADNVLYGRMMGSQKAKYRELLRHTIEENARECVHPIPPFFRFVPSDSKAEAEFNKWPSLDTIFLMNSGGIITSRDNLCVGIDAEALVRNVDRFAASPRGDTSLQEEIGFSVKGKWKVEACKAGLRAQGVTRRALKPIYFRPFDIRNIYYYPPLIDTPSRPVSEMVYRGKNLLLLAPRVKTTDEFCHVLVSRVPAETKSCSHDRATQMFPVFMREPMNANGIELNLEPRIAQTFASSLGVPIADQIPLGNQIAGYIYAVLYSSGYRSRYGAALRNSYPRIPFAQSSALSTTLARLGGDLVALHLMESPRLDQSIAAYVGPKNPEVTRISWADDCVWLGASTSNQDRRAASNRAGFRGVSELIWNFRIGGYPVCEKWLKERKDRRLSAEDIVHYQKIIVALTETLRLINEIDEAIEKQGGWPGAFETGKKSI